MKKIIIMFIICLLFCGCSRTNEIENNRIVTACIVNTDFLGTNYGFYVSVPSGSEGGEDSGAKSSSRLYEYKADSFDEAISMFEDSGTEKIDISHISLFAANEEYFARKFASDEKHIRDEISATSMIYTCIISNEYTELAKCINEEYDSKAEDFSKNLFDSTSTEFNCMMTEVSLSVNNPMYTASIPIISIQNRGEGIMPEISSVAFFAGPDKLSVAENDEFITYSNWRRKSSPFDCKCNIMAKDGKFYVSVDNESVARLSKKYLQSGTDILNIKYFGKKCFLTYDEYNHFINSLSDSDIFVSVV